MPVVPSGYHDWAAAIGVDPFHPETWPPEQHDAFVAWKRQLVDEWRAALEAMEGGNAEYIAAREPQMREDAEERLTRNPYQTCPCHPLLERPASGWPRPVPITRADVTAWRKRDPFARVAVPLPIARERIRQERDLHARPGAAAALAYIVTFRTQEAAHAGAR